MNNRSGNSKILALIDWYTPGYRGGGIITSFASLLKHLEKNFNFSILTRNSDFGTATPYELIESNKWLNFSAHTKIKYLTNSNLFFGIVNNVLSSEKYSSIYINSFFSFYFSILPVILLRLFKRKQKIVIAPMGMLCDGAIHFKKNKKIAFIRTARIIGLYNTVTWHAASALEANDIKHVFGKKANVITAAYLFSVANPDFLKKVKEGDKLKLVFISRISRKKNLLGAINCLKNVANNLIIHFDIYGPVEDEMYWIECKKAIQNLPQNIRVNYMGELKAEEVVSTFQKYHCSILPTYSENYGQIIPESLMGGTPVIISDKTPWHNLQTENAGWIIPLISDAGFVNAIENVARMDQKHFDLFQHGAYTYALKINNNPEVIENLKNIFQSNELEKKLKKVAVLVDWYLPGYKSGGPIRSCANIIAHLKTDFDFSVITSDTDANETTAYAEVKSNQWNTRPEGSNVFYFSKEYSSYKNLKSLLLNGNFDVWYMNSLFSVFYTLFPLLIARFSKTNCKLIVAPRGMLGDGALQIKPLKKKIFLSISNLLGFYKNVTWHASTDLEQQEIKKYFGNDAKVVVALNLSEPVEIKYAEREKKSGEMKLVFFSRISLKKNLHLVFDFLQKIKPANKVSFHIYGLKEEDAYWKQCIEGISKLSSNCVVEYKGTLDNAQLKTKLAQYHFSILPTMHENFGHSIVESFAAGCPVIISENTPWRNLEKEKCGWDILLNEPQKFVDVLNYCCEMNQQEFSQWSNASINKARNIIYDEKAVIENRNLFLNL